jgi:hypothetical protein
MYCRIVVQRKARGRRVGVHAQAHSVERSTLRLVQDSIADAAMAVAAAVGRAPMRVRL